MSMVNTKHIKCKGTLIKETEKAVLFQFEEIDGEHFEIPIQRWIPLSQVEKRLTSPNASEDEMWVSKWILEKAELI